MSEKDIENEEDKAVAKCIRLQRVLAVAQSRINAVAEEMEFVASKMRVEATPLALDCYKWLKPETLADVLADIEIAKQDLAHATDAATALGVTIPPQRNV